MAATTSIGSAPQFAVAGIGASAGGITALQTLLRCMPPSLELALVVVQHQSPDQTSQLARLFRAWTPIPVEAARDGLALERNRVYIAPAGHALTVQKGVFVARPFHGEGARPGIDTIDEFFESLAEDAGPRAIGVLLSGTGSDGAAGAIRIKQAGGMVLVQDPITAMHAGMPAAAIANGAADRVMPLALLAQELAAAASPSYVRVTSTTDWGDVSRAIGDIIELVRRSAGVDLTGYKTAPVLFRIQHRMDLRRAPIFGDYLALLRDDPAELEALIRGIPIHVTEFFRDAEAWGLLEGAVIPKLFSEASGQPLRVWTPACASGEEAYSLAMLLSEHASRVENPVDFTVFTTDASAEILARASRGFFTPPSMKNVSAERRRRFFYSVGGGFRIRRELRQKMVFASQDLLADPPFSNVDLITCRNLLIYLDEPAVRQVVAVLHAALRLGGYLFLGKSEFLPSRAEFGFAEVAFNSRIYRKTAPASDVDVNVPRRPARLRIARSIRKAVDAHSHEAALEQLDLPTVLVDEQLQILRIYGDTQLFLRLKPGEPSLNLLQVLVAPSIHFEVAALKARSEGSAVTITGLPDPVSGELTLSVRVTPLATSEGQGARLLVSFIRSATATPGGNGFSRPESAAQVAWSEALRLTHEELEASREELQALNEELRASNDQLNVANSDLNEANVQLRGKIDELKTQSDVLSSGAVMTLFLDEELRVRWFTPGVGELFPLGAGDIGRRITDLAPKFHRPQFADDVRAVMRTGRLHEASVRTRDERWYLQRIRPFRTNREGASEAGVAITFTDITERETAESALRASEEKISKLVALMPAGVYTCDAAGRLTFFNRRAVELWGREPALGEGHAEFHGAAQIWMTDGHELRTDADAMTDAARSGRAARDMEVAFEQPTGARMVVSANIDPLYDREGRLVGAINVFGDVSERRRAEEALRKSESALATELELTKRLHAFSTAAVETREAAGILELALTTLMHLHGVDLGNVQLYEADTAALRIVVQHGFDHEFLQHFQRVDASGSSACARALAQRRRVSVGDVEATGIDVGFREACLRAGYRAVQSTPLVTSAGVPLGVISTHFREPRVLTDAEARLTDILANELASTLERVGAAQALRASERTSRRKQVWLEAQNEAFHAAMNGAPLEASLGILARAAVDQADGERRCAFYLTEDGEALRHVVGMPEAYARRVDGFRVSPESLACGLAVSLGRPVITRDVLDEPRWQPWLKLARDYGYRGCWSFPVETTKGKLVGAFAWYFAEPREPMAEDLELAATLGKTAAIIISRHRETLNGCSPTRA